MADKKLRYACVGAGGIARKKHMNGYSKLPEIEMVAVCDTDEAAAKRLAADFGVTKTYTDYREMLDQENLDIISVCTPNFTHKPITVYALEHGCNVHVEKPIALNAAETEEIIAAEKKSGKKVMVGLNKRFLASTVLFSNLMKEDYFGYIYHVRCGWERSSGIPGVGRWFTEKKLSGGGALIDLGVHYLDLAFYALGWPEVERVVGEASHNFLVEGERIRKGYKSGVGPTDVEDMINGTAVTKDGRTVDFCFSWASNIEKETRYVEAYGTHAGFRIDNDDIWLFTRVGGTMFKMTPDVNTMPMDRNEFQSFVDCIVNDTKPEADTEHALMVMKCIDMIYADCRIWDRWLEENDPAKTKAFLPQ